MMYWERFGFSLVIRLELIIWLSVWEFLSCLCILPVQSTEISYWEIKEKSRSIHFLPDQYGGAEVSECPDDEECRRIAEQKLRLPTMFCQSWNIDKNIRELENNCMKYIAGWQNSPWLKNQLVLFLDEDLKGELNGYDLHYSFEKGLEFTKKEECE